MIIESNIPEYFLAPCGVNCFNCYKHLLEKRNCHGCLSDDINKPERCINCKIKKCTSERNIIYCFECDIYPCKDIKNLNKSYVKRYGVNIFENSEIVKIKGIVGFMKIEKERWTCHACNGVVNQHDGICSECNLQRGDP